jgi:phage/plasmid-associated DNA primase
MLDATLQNLLNIVAKKNTSKSKTYGLTDMIVPNNLWCFHDDTKQSLFWSEYCKLVLKQTSDTSKPYHYFLAEVSDESAFIVELNFRFMDSEKVRHEDGPFNDSFLCEIIQCASRVLDSQFVFTENKKELICCVLQSRKISVDPLTPDVVNYSIRLHYPFCRTKIDICDNIRKLVIKELHTSGPKLDQSALGEWSQRYDANIPMKYVPLYGSRRKACEEPLELTHIFSPYVDEDGLLLQVELGDVFEPNRHSDVLSNRIDAEILDDDLEKWLPLFFSSVYCSTVCKVNTGMGGASERAVLVQELNLVGQAITDPRYPLEFMKIFIELFEEKHEDDKKNNLPSLKDNQMLWLDIGKAYYNATNGTVEGLNLWKKYTEGSTIFNENTCEIKYPLGRDASLITYKTVAWHAKTFVSKKYEEWHHAWVHAAMDKSIKEQRHTDVAELFYRKYWLNFAYSSTGNRRGRTYRFDGNGHRWRQLADGEIIIGKILTDEFLPQFEKKQSDLFDGLNPENKSKLINRSTGRRNSKKETDEDSAQEDLELRIKNLSKIIDMLGRTQQKRCIISECQEKLFIEDFEKKLDVNPYLIGVINGVIEVDTRDSLFRAGKPEDYICMYTSIPYREDFSMSCDAVKRYIRYLNQVFPDRDLMNYMRKDIASFLKGRNSEKLFRIFSGCGDNSKSVFIKLIERAFGSYCVNVPVSVITVKRGSSSSATPETARLRGCHIATCAEPDDNETIKAGIVKSMTGNDRFFTRALFSNGEEIEAMYKLILITNKVPSIPNAGRAIKNRVIIIPFLATFVDKNYPDDDEEQYEKKLFKKDPDFEDYIPLLSQAMLWCAVQDYRNYCQEGLKKLPKVIVDETNTYWEENDPYDLFIREKLVKEVVNENEIQDNDFGDFIQVVPVETEDGEGADLVKTGRKKKTQKKEIKYTTELLMTDLYRVFKAWIKEAFPGINPMPDQPQVKTEMANRLGPQKNRKWLGWSVREEEKNIF